MPTGDCPYRASDLPDVRLQLMDLWKPGKPFHQAAQLQGSPTSTFRTQEREVLAEAELWWVSPETCATVHRAAESFPDDTVMDETWLPSPSGFAVFSIPFSGKDAQNENSEVRVDALTWGPVRLKSRVSGARAEGVTMTSYTWMSDLAVLAPLGRADWVYRRRVDVDSFDDDPLPRTALESVVEDRKILATLCALVANTKLVTDTDEPVPRQTRRRSERAGVDAAKVRVHSLHVRGEGRSTDVSDEESRYRVRWVVRGHWRSQPYGPGREYRRPTWIGEHVKGPEGAPLLDPSQRVNRI